MGFGFDRIGQWSDELTFEVTADRTMAYAAATDDPIAEHRSGELAPPVFAVVPIWDAIVAAMSGVAPAGDLLSVVHGEQDMRFHRQLTPGMVLRSRAAPVGIHPKPSGTTVVVKVESRDDVGLVVEQYMTSFFRGVDAGADGHGEVAPPHKLDGALKAGEAVAVIDQKIDGDQTFRYAEASGDHMPIHLDDEIARSVGLPGIIVHGLCTMAFTSWGAIQAVGGDEPRKLARLAVRFSKPVLPGQEITTRFWAVGVTAGVSSYAYETTNPDGDVVIKDGLVEIRS
jgi:acyl dehydratase